MYMARPWNTMRISVNTAMKCNLDMEAQPRKLNRSSLIRKKFAFLSTIELDIRDIGWCSRNPYISDDVYFAIKSLSDEIEVPEHAIYKVIGSWVGLHELFIKAGIEHKRPVDKTDVLRDTACLIETYVKLQGVETNFPGLKEKSLWVFCFLNLETLNHLNKVADAMGIRVANLIKVVGCWYGLLDLAEKAGVSNSEDK